MLRVVGIENENMDVEEYIKNWDDETNCKPYDYGKFWKMYSGFSYSKLNRKQKMMWRTNVKDVAEQIGNLMPWEWYTEI